MFRSGEPFEPQVSKYGSGQAGVVLLNVSKYGCKQFLREPMEPPGGLQTVSKKGTVGTGVASGFQIGNHWIHQFLNIKPLEQGFQTVSK